ncbi:hypothetical protein BDV26DRAFT_288920 [Aspergillus bertholletiae]|uniref:Uncharacterized protein n=1 Tax=Aspergillus bertholletiae TaxID=1226010 RepID=A0A5N7BJH9_9EURO|nr:hypothetical protein BDV26DRAFT_288920 [Aspergillus bertholletiae]
MRRVALPLQFDTCVIRWGHLINIVGFPTTSDLYYAIPVHQEYLGFTLDSPQKRVESQVIIEFPLAFIKNPDTRPKVGIGDLVTDDQYELKPSFKACDSCEEVGCCGNDWVYGDYEIDEIERRNFKNKYQSLLDCRDSAEKLCDDHKCLLPYQVYGFVLRTRSWATFDINFLEEVKHARG